MFFIPFSLISISTAWSTLTALSVTIDRTACRHHVMMNIIGIKCSLAVWGFAKKKSGKFLTSFLEFLILCSGHKEIIIKEADSYTLSNSAMLDRYATIRSTYVESPRLHRLLGFAEPLYLTFPCHQPRQPLPQAPEPHAHGHPHSARLPTKASFSPARTWQHLVGR